MTRHPVYGAGVLELWDHGGLWGREQRRRIWLGRGWGWVTGGALKVEVLGSEIDVGLGTAYSLYLACPVNR